MTEKLKVLDLFSGLGGFSLGLERTGHFETVAFCDNDKFSKLILDKHWKGKKVYEDVREITKEKLATPRKSLCMPRMKLSTRAASIERKYSKPSLCLSTSGDPSSSSSAAASAVLESSDIQWIPEGTLDDCHGAHEPAPRGEPP